MQKRENVKECIPTIDALNDAIDALNYVMTQRQCPKHIVTRIKEYLVAKTKHSLHDLLNKFITYDGNLQNLQFYTSACSQYVNIVCSNEKPSFVKILRINKPDKVKVMFYKTFEFCTNILISRDNSTVLMLTGSELTITSIDVEEKNKGNDIYYVECDDIHDVSPDGSVALVSGSNTFLYYKNARQQSQQYHITKACRLAKYQSMHGKKYLAIVQRYKTGNKNLLTIYDVTHDAPQVINTFIIGYVFSLQFVNNYLIVKTGSTIIQIKNCFKQHASKIEHNFNIVASRLSIIDETPKKQTPTLLYYKSECLVLMCDDCQLCCLNYQIPLILLSIQYHYIPELRVIMYIDRYNYLRVYDVDKKIQLYDLALKNILWFDIQLNHLTILNVDCTLYHWTTV